MLDFKFDQYGTVPLTYENAMTLRAKLLGGDSVALALDLGNMTMFHVSFVPLLYAVPQEAIYEDGSSRGLQINIDRISSYSLPWNSPPNEAGYIAEKWKLTLADAEALWPFINTILTGEDYWKPQPMRYSTVRKVSEEELKNIL